MMPSKAKTRQAGLSLVEMMIAITLGLLILAGLSMVFLNSMRARNEIERTNRQIENGRYAMQLLSDDLHNAGYLAEFDTGLLSTPGTKPDACATALADLKTALPLHIQGYNNATTIPDCISDVKSGTDILVVRRASTCVPGVGNCDPVVANTPYFQASLCDSSNELASTNTDYSTNYYALHTDTAQLTRHKRDCSTVADIHRYRTHIYFIANNNQSGDGIPTLKRWELGATSSVVALVEGIENLQIEYGIDLPPTTGAPLQIDGTPDSYTSDPDNYPVATGKNEVDNWRNVVSAKIFLLSRNTEATADHQDNKTYALDSAGTQFDPCSSLSGSAQITCKSFKRHLYQAVVRLNNPAGRNAP